MNEDEAQMEKYKLCLDYLNQDLLIDEAYMATHYNTCHNDEELMEEIGDMTNFYKLCFEELKDHIDASEIDMSEDDWLIKCMASFKEKMWSKLETIKEWSKLENAKEYERKR